MRLEDLIGQEHAVALLRQAVARGRVPHAYLFDGPRGVGKRAAGRGLALALNCEAPPTAGGSCGTCEACRRILAGLHPDVVEFAPDGAQIVMEQAQEIVTLAQRPPHEARARTVIVDEADRLNPNAANCLLKTLEEPAPGTHLVLVTAAPDRMLPTIRSRTQRIRFAKVPATTLVTWAEQRGMARGAAEAAALLADGSVERFLALAEGTSEDDRRAAARILELGSVPPRTRAGATGAGAPKASRSTSSPALSLSPMLELAAELGDRANKEALPTILALVARAYRNALVRASGAAELALELEAQQAPQGDAEQPDGDGASLRIADGSSPEELARAIEAVLEADTDLAGNVNPVLVLERLLLRLPRARAGIRAARELGRIGS